MQAKLSPMAYLYYLGYRVLFTRDCVPRYLVAQG